jgi:hypothetical protein
MELGRSNETCSSDQSFAVLAEAAAVPVRANERLDDDDVEVKHVQGNQQMDGTYG